MLLLLEKGQKIRREDITRRLVEILYERNDGDFRRGTFRVRGDVIEVYPTYDEMAYRIELFGDEIEALSQIDPLFGTVRQKYARLPIYPKSHYVVQPERKTTGDGFHPRRAGVVGKAAGVAGAAGGGAARPPADAFRSGDDQVRRATAMASRTTRATSPAGCRAKPPPTLLDYFPRDYLLFIDEIARDRSAVAWHVAWRPFAQAEPGGLRLPPAFGAWTIGR